MNTSKKQQLPEMDKKRDEPTNSQLQGSPCKKQLLLKIIDAPSKKLRVVKEDA